METEGQKRGLSFWDISTLNLQMRRQQHQHLERCLVIRNCKQACALHKLRVHFCDVSSASLQTSASEKYQELTIKAPPEVGYLFSESKREPARYVRLMKSFYGLTSARRVWWLDITQKLSQLGSTPMSTDQCLWCRCSNEGELRGSLEFMLTTSCEIVFVSL